MGFTSSPGISRSSSTPNLTSLSTYQYGTSAQQRPERGSAKGFVEPSFNNDFSLDTTFRSEPNSRSFTLLQPAAGNKMESQSQRPPAPIRRRTGSLMDKSRQWFPLSKAASKDAAPARSETPSRDTSNDTKSASPGLAKTTTEALTNFAKRSWLPSSSTPSESPPIKSSTSKLVGSRRPDLTVDREAAVNRWSEPTKSTPISLTRATSYFNKMKPKQSLIEKSVDSDSRSDSSEASDGTPAANSPAIFSPKTSPDDNTDTPTTDDSFGGPTVQLNDPLWPAFKAAEMDFGVFTTKSASQKVIMVRTNFLPFLQKTANHWSTKRLYPEDLDRRTQVLSIWWNEMLDMLDGTAVIKVDRPILYEALTTIMMRLEWRLTTPHFLSSADRNLRETLRCDSWGKGQPSPSDADKPTTLIEAAERNVRTTFISNLVKQVVFAVEKASLRYAPFPLMSFVGKTCAYAFFFIPGFAEILAQQWNISQHQLKRTADELGVPPVSRAEKETFELFPPHLRSLTWTTPRSMFTFLRRKYETPASMPTLSWAGHWTPRWKGLDNDLFFVFCKYFHILSNDFMPPDLSMAEKAQSPAFVLVQAQLLLTIDKTLHRRSEEAAAVNTPPPPTKGPPLVDLSAEPDATALGLSLPLSELSALPKNMSESAVIVLLREVLFDSTADHEGARQTFAETFSRLMAGAVRKTSLFDSHACFTLCDFLEESLALYDEFAWPKTPNQYSDWSFWLDVFKKMLLSLNTVTEVRVLCFIFSIWKILTRDPKRKAALCIDWLLSEEVFSSFYNHWCPLVRGYYHRLLCWRICRYEGEPSELDLRIFNLAALRLKTAWSHYLYLKQTAEQEGRFPPSTVAMVPTPGKKFMIIRLEPEPTRIGPSQTFEQMSRSTGPEVILGDDEIGIGLITGSNAGTKKKKSLLDKVIAFSAQVGHTPVSLPDDNLGLRPAIRTGSWDDELSNARRETAESRVRSPPLPSTSTFGSINGIDSTVSPAAPEEPTNPFRFILALSEPAGPSLERVLTVPRLPMAAQSAITLPIRESSLSPSSTKLWPPAPDCPPPPPPTSAVGGMGPGSDNQGVKDMRSSQDDASVMRSDTPTAPLERTTADSMGTLSKPMGISGKNAVYAGRSLAEWAQVVAECNHFAERRRQEGVVAMKDIEVPALIVDGFQGMGG